MTLRGILGVAVVGAGRMGADHVRRLDRATSGARVAAVADVDRERAERAADGVEDCAVHSEPLAVLDDPAVGAVLVASPGPAHEEVLTAALERGLPVLCEKPLTPDPESALRVVRAEAALGRRLVQVGFMRRYDAGFRKLKSLVDSGVQGRPLMLHFRHRNVSSPPGFTGPMTIRDSAVHEFDTVRWLLGQEITAVTVVRPAASSGAPEGLGDPQLLLLETSRGAVADVELFLNCGFGYQVTCEVVSERGTARTGDETGPVVEGPGARCREIPPDYLVRFADAYDLQVQRWVDAARRGTVEGPDCWDGYAAAAVCEAGVRARETGARVAVETEAPPDLYR
ncbi:Gfo/Idh/MocA family protein [Streptomyces sp. HB2AG]|uniref:Gfo/Idh/MocA family protein n=1 Tax=Streptomyces sp. HB2AG TaxID=2983400 RepID=UPI0022AAB427|nr:Gfo/Idh/MocA family oxidoreductase [Streptomyces sp. HB2AG]MCZ2524632.1 Gfo/Idh/MocA family oxidoreductase [Streptomyces sp. HB2AG]